jgi:hypothetical protein
MSLFVTVKAVLIGEAIFASILAFIVLSVTSSNILILLTIDCCVSASQSTAVCPCCPPNFGQSPSNVLCVFFEFLPFFVSAPSSAVMAMSFGFLWLHLPPTIVLYTMILQGLSGPSLDICVFLFYCLELLQLLPTGASYAAGDSQCKQVSNQLNAIFLIALLTFLRRLFNCLSFIIIVLGFSFFSYP